MRVRNGPIIFLLAAAFVASAQAQIAPAPAATAPLREIRAEGLKSVSEPQVGTLSGLQIGTQVGKDDLQAAADKLVQSGLFAKVRYNFQSRTDGVALTFHVEEAPRIPAYFDNLPWFADSELNEAIRAKLPFYDGTLPEAGAVVDQAAEALGQFLVTHGLQAAIEHQVAANPLGDGNVQQFRINAEALRIAGVEFSDPAMRSASALMRKPYSRTSIDMFLTE